MSNDSFNSFLADVRVWEKCYNFAKVDTFITAIAHNVTYEPIDEYDTTSVLFNLAHAQALFDCKSRVNLFPKAFMSAVGNVSSTEKLNYFYDRANEIGKTFEDFLVNPEEANSFISCVHTQVISFRFKRLSRFTAV